MANSPPPILVDLLQLRRDHKCLPLTLGDNQETGPRLGGRAPEGILPEVPSPNLHYLLTLVLSPTQECSIFIDAPDQILSAPATTMCYDNRVQVIKHGPSQRGQGSRYDSWLSGHQIIYLPPVDDEMVTEDGEHFPQGMFKIGGNPYMIQQTKRIIEGVATAQQAGFRQFLQVDTPAQRAPRIHGSWPFFDGTLNLFARPEPELNEFCYFWQY